MTETNEEEEKTIKMVVLMVECEVDSVNGDDEHMWALPLHRRYMVPRERVEGEKREITRDIRVSQGVWRFLKNIGHEILMETDEAPSMDEILRANKFNITPKAVREMRERRKGVPIATDDGGEEKEKRKTLLGAAIEDKERREKEEKTKNENRR